MTEVSRKEFKADPVYKKLYLAIRKNHKVPRHTHKTLLENRHVKNFVESSRTYLIIKKKTQLLISYDIDSWLVGGDLIEARITSMRIYDNLMEFEKAKSEMYKVAPGDATIPNQN